ncbi:MAG: preprotein translocase subunit SecA [Patescibacteria group bacterium]|nr:preprotein translocase subunit SecA [Patescibacteria group bacterium]
MLDFLFNPVNKLKPIVEKINAIEKEISSLSNEQLKEESNKLIGLEITETELVRGFAIIREAAKRTLGQRHFDVQLMGGIAMHEGRIAEMATGEGKTLASTAPIYLNALSKKGVHVVTVNEYLAKRDAVWMGQIYYSLGLSVACLVHEGALIYDPEYISKNAEELIDKERDTTGAFLVQTEYLRPITRKEAYLADITYGTNHEFGFDYLRDNLAYSIAGQVQRDPYYAVIDEIDSILIDEARTPLIISAPDEESSEFYKLFSKIVALLKKDEDYIVDEKMHSVDITEAGINKVESSLKISNLYAAENLKLTHYLQETLKAYGLFKRDKDYVVKNGEIIIVDQFTGRLMPGRRYSGGLHQALESKENLKIQNESKTYAQITIQNYFRLYKKICGMTGTARTSAEEFEKVYGLKVFSIPTNKPIARKDLTDLIYKNEAAKYNAIITDVKERQKKGQPVLIGSISIAKNELLSALLTKSGIRHEILNAKNNEREGAIIAQAGKLGAVTVATNMAGRGVDIILGGNPIDPAENQKVKDLGGLHVIGTERHDARRIDYQLRGRSGRQGDPGSSQFFLSLEDDLLRIFGGDRIKNMMSNFNIPDDMPIEAGIISKAVSQAQSKVEGFNFDNRQNLLEYDDVLNKQRMAIYAKRQELLKKNTHPQILSVLDMFWMNHLENIEALRDSVRIRAYAQHDPLVEYRRESHILYRQMLDGFEKWVAENEERINELTKKQNEAAAASFIVNTAKRSQSSAIPGNSVQSSPLKDSTRNPEKKNWIPTGVYPESTRGTGMTSKKVGRNDPCPCGSGKKYKKCHGK